MSRKDNKSISQKISCLFFIIMLLPSLSWSCSCFNGHYLYTVFFHKPFVNCRLDRSTAVASISGGGNSAMTTIEGCNMTVDKNYVYRSHKIKVAEDNQCIAAILDACQKLSIPILNM